MQIPRRGRRNVAAASGAAPAPSSPETGVAAGAAWGKVSAVLFDMDGVLCNSEEPSRQAGVDVFAEMGVEVTVDDFVPFMGTGNHLVVQLSMANCQWSSCISFLD